MKLSTTAVNLTVVGVLTTAGVGVGYNIGTEKTNDHFLNTVRMTLKANIQELQYQGIAPEHIVQLVLYGYVKPTVKCIEDAGIAADPADIDAFKTACVATNLIAGKASE